MVALGKTPWSSGKGQEIMGSNPDSAEETIYHAPLIWIKSMNAKNCGKVTWHCCMCCNPALNTDVFL